MSDIHCFRDMQVLKTVAYMQSVTSELTTCTYIYLHMHTHACKLPVVICGLNSSPIRSTIRHNTSSPLTETYRAKHNISDDKQFRLLISPW